MLEELKTDEKDLIEHFSKMHSLVFFTWELLIKDIDNLAKVAHKAATEHELPKLDDDSIEKIRITIVKKLCGEYFKNLQLIEIQLEHEAAKL